MYEVVERLGLADAGSLLRGWMESPELKLAVSLVGSLCTWFWGGWTEPLKVLVAFMSVDFVTGWLAACKEGRRSSSAGVQGVGRKVGQLLMVGLVHLLDLLFGLEVPLLATAIIWFYVGHEGESILENAEILGWPLPRALQRLFQQAQSQVDEQIENVATRFGRR